MTCDKCCLVGELADNLARHNEHIFACLIALQIQLLAVIHISTLKQPDFPRTPVAQNKIPSHQTLTIFITKGLGIPGGD